MKNIDKDKRKSKNSGIITKTTHFYLAILIA